jgi:hypothetical protein
VLEPKDPQRAATFFEASCDAGNPLGCKELASIAPERANQLNERADAIIQEKTAERDEAVAQRRAQTPEGEDMGLLPGQRFRRCIDACGEESRRWTAACRSQFGNSGEEAAAMSCLAPLRQAELDFTSQFPTP